MPHALAYGERVLDPRLLAGAHKAWRHGEKNLVAAKDEMRGWQAGEVPKLVRDHVVADALVVVAHLGGERAWESHCSEEAYLTYFDLQCYGEQTVKLPEDKLYRAELIDVWNMTREVIAESISGEIKLALPGRDNLALLITRIK